MGYDPNQLNKPVSISGRETDTTTSNNQHVTTTKSGNKVFLDVGAGGGSETPFSYDGFDATYTGANLMEIHYTNLANTVASYWFTYDGSNNMTNMTSTVY